MAPELIEYEVDCAVQGLGISNARGNSLNYSRGRCTTEEIEAALGMLG